MLSQQPIGKLYLVPTPIGNLGDITYRAVDVLKNKVEKILAEDTRNTSILLKKYEISTPMESFHQHNEHGKISRIIKELQHGAVYAQVSDAGTPGISDPGYLLVNKCLEAQIPIEILPGATAFIPALIKSGFALHQFLFEGFIPQKKGKQTKIKEIAENDATVVFYESPHRLVKTLEMLLLFCKEDRNISVSRELTKKFEQTITGRLVDVKNYFVKNTPKGEIVVVIEGKNNTTVHE